MMGVSDKITRAEKKLTPAQMAQGLMRKHGDKYAMRMIEKLMELIAPDTRANLPVGPLFYDQVGPKDWRLRVPPLDRTLNYWMSVYNVMKKTIQ